MQSFRGVFWMLLVVGCQAWAVGEDPFARDSLADTRLTAFFREETVRIQRRSAGALHGGEAWRSRQEAARAQLQEMLGLSPWPERAELKPGITHRVEGEGFTVETLHFQSLPGLYVTGNLYVPRGLNGAVPAVLYFCGHSKVASNGVSYGNKVAYQRHGVWLARHGYVCLIVDTVQLGEIEGIHHGTYREGMWWWNSRGYTPAGVEAWNGIRALDYLVTRPEVDAERLGVTGRSGGGATSWWVAALDTRVRVAAPVAGITDLWNHVVDGTVEGHCDCMFMVNTYGWDYCQVAALVAPRALLIANSDKDPIFPLDGVVRLHADVRRVYAGYGASARLGFLITEGPHEDTQDLQLPVFRWFNRHLGSRDPLIEEAAQARFRPEQLRTFETLPADRINNTVHERFVPWVASPAVPSTAQAWPGMRDAWMRVLRERVFGGWPEVRRELRLRNVWDRTRDRLRLEAWSFESQPEVPLRLVVLRGVGRRQVHSVTFHVLDEAGWQSWHERLGPWLSAHLTDAGDVREHAQALRKGGLGEGEAVVLLAPRGIGPGAWSGDAAKQVQIRRRFMLLGQTLDGMRVWDIVRGVEALRGLEGFHAAQVTLQSAGTMAVNTLYASLFTEGVAELVLRAMPATHGVSPDYLNILRFMDIEVPVAMAAERAPLEFLETDPAVWDYAQRAGAVLGWRPDRVRARAVPADSPREPR